MTWILRIMIATAIVNILSHVVSQPLAKRLHLRSTKGQSELTCFIAADVFVLGIAGFIAGLLGFWFIGFSFGGKGWPGLLAFIAMSILGVTLFHPGVL